MCISEENYIWQQFMLLLPTCAFKVMPLSQKKLYIPLWMAEEVHVPAKHILFSLSRNIWDNFWNIDYCVVLCMHWCQKRAFVILNNMLRWNHWENAFVSKTQQTWKNSWLLVNHIVQCTHTRTKRVFAEKNWKNWILSTI